MTFYQALKQIIKGNKVTRPIWMKERDSYGMLKDDKLMFHLVGRDYDWIISKADLDAKDWKIL